MLELDMGVVDMVRVESGCHSVINVLKPFSKIEKLAILYYLMETFPEPYKIIEIDKR
jgi:hypothetical protein